MMVLVPARSSRTWSSRLLAAAILLGGLAAPSISAAPAGQDWWEPLGYLFENEWYAYARVARAAQDFHDDRGCAEVVGHHPEPQDAATRSYRKAFEAAVGMHPDAFQRLHFEAQYRFRGFLREAWRSGAGPGFPRYSAALAEAIAAGTETAGEAAAAAAYAEVANRGNDLPSDSEVEAVLALEEAGLGQRLTDARDYKAFPDPWHSSGPGVGDWAACQGLRAELGFGPEALGVAYQRIQTMILAWETRLEVETLAAVLGKGLATSDPMREALGELRAWLASLEGRDQELAGRFQDRLFPDGMVPGTLAEDLVRAAEARAEEEEPLADPDEFDPDRPRPEPVRIEAPQQGWLSD